SRNLEPDTDSVDHWKTVAPDPADPAASSVVEDQWKTTPPAEHNPNVAGVSPGESDRIGRYRIEKVLGHGGFGGLSRALDAELHRAVAVKVPHRQRTERVEDVEAYLTEARILASLDHPNIVPVHDVGRTESGLCFVVSKFIEGSDLARKLEQARLT